MIVALGKNNRLADLTAVVDFQGVLHHDIQDLPDGVLVEQPTVQSRCINAGRQVAVFILKGVFVGFPFFVRKLIIGDAFLHELYFALHREEVNQKAILDGLRQLIAIGGHTVFEVKDLVGVFVDLILGRGSQANQRCIEIMEDVAVFIVDGAVCFVADDHIKMATGEQLALCIVNGINAVHHGLIGREHAVCRKVVFVLAEVRHGKLRQEVDKAALCLGHKTVAVSQKQHVFDPAMLQ